LFYERMDAVELRDYEFNVDHIEILLLLKTFEAELRQSAADMWTMVVTGQMLDIGLSHRGLIRDA